MKLMATNLVTMIVTAVVTSAFWLLLYSHKPVPSPSATTPARTVSGAVEPAPPGGLIVPVAGIRPSELIDTFTQARAGGKRVHDAIDIAASAGTPVVAAAPGRIEKLFFSRGGGGITAYVRSDDGSWIYYYAHLQAYAPDLAEGRRVERGSPVGTVGASGNASTPHLHFAVHRMAPGEKWYQGTAINPYALLSPSSGTR